MASKDHANVIRRSNRGRTAIDAKTKTDSGCFVDDDVDKQSQIDKSSPRNSSESEIVNVSLLDRNIKNTPNDHINVISQDAVAHPREMSHSDEPVNDEETEKKSSSSTNSSVSDTKPKEDFYCLYYSDSPNGSLTRSKEKKRTFSTSDNDGDINGKAEEILKKVKSEALKNTSFDDKPSTLDKPSVKAKPPPVAPKPVRSSKNISPKSSKDPILDELDKLGASVGRDFSGVKEKDPDLFSNAVKELQVAGTPQECFDHFDAIQNALLENVPDTLERKKAKDAKEETRRKSLPGADRTRKLSDSSSKDVNVSKTKENKADSTSKVGKQKSEVKKYSRTERESLHFMKEDSHHKRSHMNTETTSRSIFARPDSYRSTKADTTKRTAEKKVTSKEIIKKDKKLATPTKGAKIGKKVDTTGKSERANSYSSTKRKERFEHRSSRRRINGDLTSIPEDGVIGVRIDDLEDNAIPLAKGEDDLSSGEDDLGTYDENKAEDTTDPSFEELTMPPPPSPTEIPMNSKNVEDMIVSSQKAKELNTFEKDTTILIQKSQEPTKHVREETRPSSTANLQKFESTNDSHEKLPSQQRLICSQHLSLSSDGWTSESTAGYSSANDADDEIERPTQLETSEDFETYQDPGDLADMTFGTVIDDEGNDEHAHLEDAPKKVPRSDIIVERRQRLPRKHVTDNNISPPTLNNCSNLPQEVFLEEGHVEEGLTFDSEEYNLDVQAQYEYEPEYYENEREEVHFDNSNDMESSVPQTNHMMSEEMSYENPSFDRQSQEDHQVEHRTVNLENRPDPSGFMTVEDIKRLIFQGKKPPIPRSSSFCGTSRNMKEKLVQEQDDFQRQSWSGYSARQQQQPVIDPLVKEYPRRRTPLEGSKESPYVRTVVQKPSRQQEFYSESNLAVRNERNKSRVCRSQSFCSETSLPHRMNSLNNYHPNIAGEDRGKRSRSFCEALSQRRANSFDEDYQSNRDGRTGRSHSLRGSPLQRRANSLDDYYYSNKVRSSSHRSSKPSQRDRFFRTPSDSSSDYSHSDNEQYHEQIYRKSNSSRRAENSSVAQYIDTRELVKLLSPQLAHEVRQELTPHMTSFNNNNINGRLTIPRKTSESLRIQAIRRASQVNGDSDSDGNVDTVKSVPNSQTVKSSAPASNIPQKRPTLSQRFSEVPQRVNFDELAEQLNLPSDDEEDEAVDGTLGSRSESEFGADLEFDFGDYFDDNNMIVGEALRLKKVLGCDTKQDPELETLVSKVTEPTIERNQSNRAHVKLGTQTVHYLTTERPPSYNEVRKEMRARRMDDKNHFNMYDTDSSYLSDNSEYSQRTTQTYTHSDASRFSESESSDYAHHSEPKAHSYVKTEASQRRRDPGTQTVVKRPTSEKVISSDELVKLIINSSQRNLNQNKPAQQNPKSTVQSLLFPVPQTKAASTGNIHTEKKFPGHVHQLYGSADVNSDKSSLNRRRGHSPPIKYHKSHESLRRDNHATTSLLKARLVSSSENVEDRPSNPTKRVFEEEVDCMRTKSVGDFSSGEISSGSSLYDVVGKKTSPVASVSYIGCEETKGIETLPRIRQSSHRKRRKEVVGFLSDQDIPTILNVDKNQELRLYKELPMENARKPTSNKQVESKNVDVDFTEKTSSTKKQMSIIDHCQANNVAYTTDEGSPQMPIEDQTIHFPNDNLPSPNSVNVFIDYKKNVMKVTTSTPKIQHGKLITDSPTNLSPVSGSPIEEKKASPKGSIGHEEFPPRYDSGSSSDQSSSVYSSDEEKFFGSSDTVVFVDQKAESPSSKPTVDATLPNGKDASASNGYHNDITDDINAYSQRVDSLLREVRSSLDLDSIGSDLLDQAMERVKDRLSPRSSDQAFGGLTMEAYVALNQADELQSIINEIKGELQVLQEENSMLKETVVSLQHCDSRSASETTEASLTESAERIDSIRKQIAAVVLNREGDRSEEEDLINIDVLLRGFGETVGLRTHKKTDVKLGQVTVKGGADWTGVYDAAKKTFLDHIRRIDASSCLGLGPTSMYGAQIGATMLTPETLRRKNPRVEISRKYNSCAIQLKDGMTDCFDALIYDTLLPKHVLENFVHQILEHRFVVLCGSQGLGKTHLATKLAEHVAQRFGSNSQNAVMTLSVGEKSRKELKKTLANLMKCNISTLSDGVPVVVILDQLDCLASLADIFEPKQLEGNRNSPFIIGVRNKSKKGPFSSKELAIHKYFRWIQMSVYDRHVLSLLERFLRRKLCWSDTVEEEEDLMDLFIWLTQVWQRINQILLSYIDVEATIGPSVFYSCPLDIQAAEGWFANVWNYTIIPYLHQNIRNSRKIYERDVPWEDPTKWVIMRWPWSRERSKVLPTLKKLRQVDIVLDRNNMHSAKENKKESRSRSRKLRSNVLQSPSKAGSLESWSTADWETASIGSDDESIASSTL